MSSGHSIATGPSEEDEREPTLTEEEISDEDEDNDEPETNNEGDERFKIDAEKIVKQVLMILRTFTGPTLDEVTIDLVNYGYMTLQAYRRWREKRNGRQSENSETENETDGDDEDEEEGAKAG